MSLAEVALNSFQCDKTHNCNTVNEETGPYEVVLCDCLSCDINSEGFELVVLDHDQEYLCEEENDEFVIVGDEDWLGGEIPDETE
jgi:hypothetical protein